MNVEKRTPTVYQDIFGWFNFEGFYDLLIESLLPDNFRFVEVGVFMGKSIIYFAEKMSIENKNGQIFGVDHFKGSDEEAHKDILKNLNLSDEYYKNITKTGASNLIITIPFESDLAVNHFDDNSLDCVFLDGSHDYKSIKNDLEIWIPKVKENGYICGHDYYGDWEAGVRQAVNEILIEKYKFNVSGHSDWGVFWSKKETFSNFIDETNNI